MIPSPETRIDWFRVLADLKAKSWSLHAVSHFTGIPKSNLSSYKAGAQPSYHYGVQLLSCWAQSCDKDRADAPTIDPYSFKA